MRHPGGGEEGRQPGDAVGQEQGDAGALADAERDEGGGDARGAAVERPIAQRLLCGDDRLAVGARGEAAGEQPRDGFEQPSSDIG